ncbi:type I 3-dehydroquinate dehydratase [Lactobacillus gasseri]|uniref:type I 3-dehydroquinate dehydratase n=1 Tax=Lactobacillus gasseri TaxID=1596 RepID=UPI001192564B|nr:type I 3-dehydroquinate dehydratase [Lactobacillus gasseri]TVU93653.1 type I 3-dehydroquinate dehydratase [Lactobacillus gasseri]TVV14536.1 type I 3-dehydroquinate dehydratase [Lactobacillus gasseri]
MSFEKKKVAVNNQTFLTLVNTGISEDDVIKQTQEIKKLQPEMMEWRIDYFEDVVLMNRLLEVAGKVKTVMDKTPVLITFRSKKFGGKTELDSEDAYLNLVKIAIDFKLGNAIDIERDHVPDRVAGLIQDAKAKELGVVLS